MPGARDKPNDAIGALNVLRQALDQAERDQARSFELGRMSLAIELRAWLDGKFQPGQDHAPMEEYLNTDLQKQQTVHPPASLPDLTGKVGRAIRGTSAKVIDDVFTNVGTGLPVSEISRAALERGHNLSLEAIGNELRRHNGRKYHRAGYRWYPGPMPIANREEAADPTPSSDRSTASVETPNDAERRGEVVYDNITP